MKKISVICVILLSVLTIGTCWAMPISEMSLGGVTLGMSRQAVKNIYGDPAKISCRTTATEIPIEVEDWLYGENFEISFVKDSVIFISTSGNNGIKTPSGLTYGAQQFDVRRYYGQTYNDYPYECSDEGIHHMIYFIGHPVQGAIDFGCKGGKVSFIHIYFPD